jgi:hypothetical protein
MIISNELEPIPLRVPVSERPSSSDFGIDDVGNGARSVGTETADASGDIAGSGENVTPPTPPEPSRDVFDRDEALRMLSGASTASEDKRGDDFGERVPDVGSADININM